MVLQVDLYKNIPGEMKTAIPLNVKWVAWADASDDESYALFRGLTTSMIGSRGSTLVEGVRVGLPGKSYLLAWGD